MRFGKVLAVAALLAAGLGSAQASENWMGGGQPPRAAKGFAASWWTPAAERPRHRRARHARSAHRHRVAPKIAERSIGFFPARGGSLIASMRADIGTNPTGWRRQWCGRYMAMKTCQSSPRLNKAENWLDAGPRAPWGAVGSVMVQPHHVGVVTGRCADGSIKIVSGNFGPRGVDEGCARGRILGFVWAQGCGFSSTKPVDVASSDEKKEDYSEKNSGDVPRETPPGTREFVKVGPLAIAKPELIDDAARAEIFKRNADDEYLWQVYLRTPEKVDSSGDFTWKDKAAAAKRKMSLEQYVIGGMSTKFKRALAKAGRAMDAAGIRWSMLSGFRDDYRQKIAEGFKASARNSLHGGSRATCGYSCGRAADIVLAGVAVDDDARRRAADWVARNGRKFGLARPMPGRDPMHVQLAGETRVARRGHARHRWARAHRGKRMAER